MAEGSTVAKRPLRTASITPETEFTSIMMRGTMPSGAK